MPVNRLSRLASAAALLVGTATATAAALLTSCSGSAPTTSAVVTRSKTPQSDDIGSPAPEISGEDLDGQPFKLSDYRGKVVLLDFWGHW